MIVGAAERISDANMLRSEVFTNEHADMLAAFVAMLYLHRPNMQVSGTGHLYIHKHRLQTLCMKYLQIDRFEWTRSEMDQIWHMKAMALLSRQVLSHQNDIELAVETLQDVKRLWGISAHRVELFVVDAAAP